MSHNGLSSITEANSRAASIPINAVGYTGLLMPGRLLVSPEQLRNPRHGQAPHDARRIEPVEPGQ